MTDEELLQIAEKKVFSSTGLTFAMAQKDRLLRFLSECAVKNNKSLEEYVLSFDCASADFQTFISEVTINETYFFRESHQFEFLQNHVFPKFAGKKMRIWSGACSTGEEAISLLALALSCGVDAEVVASDIDLKAIEFFKKGLYMPFSFRKDGSKFHSLLKPYGKYAGDNFQFNSDFVNRIKLLRVNLTDESSFINVPKMDLVFLRNVFIYFDKETRFAVTKRIAGIMNENGCLFFSTNEIGSFGTDYSECNLYKAHEGNLYYFEKDSARKSTVSKIKLSDSENKSQISFIGKTALRKNSAISSFKNQLKKKENEKAIIHIETKIEKKLDLNKEFEEVCGYVNHNNFDAAIAKGKEVEAIKENACYGIFFQAYAEYYADKKDSAENLFKKSLNLKYDFWPSYFYMGLLYKDMGKYEEASIKLKACLELLENNPVLEKKYNFVLGTLDCAYIKKICKSLGNA